MWHALAYAQHMYLIAVHDLLAEVLGSLKCDCAEQLQLAMQYIQDKQPGMIIYLQQEGRGIGLANKIAAYALQVGHLFVVHADVCITLVVSSPCCQLYSVACLLLQEEGYDTVDANRALGYPDDCREYTSVHNILRDLGVKSIRLMVGALVPATATTVQPLPRQPYTDNGHQSDMKTVLNADQQPAKDGIPAGTGR
jgi:GTP cyclohydrolase II